MERSNCLRAIDMRAIFHLLGEMQELRGNQRIMRCHMLASLCLIFNARQGSFLAFSGFVERGSVRLPDSARGGSPGAEAAAFWNLACTMQQRRGEPTLNAANSIPGLATPLRRQDIIGDRDWFRCIIYNEFGKAAGCNGMPAAWHGGSEPAPVNGVTLQWATGERPFSARALGLLQLFNEELYAAHRKGWYVPQPLPTPERIAPLAQPVIQVVRPPAPPMTAPTPRWRASAAVAGARRSLVAGLGGGEAARCAATAAGRYVPATRPPAAPAGADMLAAAAAALPGVVVVERAAAHAPHILPDGRIRLTPRQDQVLRGLLAGDSVKQIALACKLSPFTVDEHRGEIYRKFNVSARAELLARFITHVVLGITLWLTPGRARGRNAGIIHDEIGSDQTSFIQCGC